MPQRHQHKPEHSASQMLDSMDLDGQKQVGNGDSINDQDSDVGDVEESTPIDAHDVGQQATKDRLAFQEFARKEASKLPVKSNKDVDDDEVDEANMSLKDMMARQQSTRIIGSPRDYQTELFERAKKQNTIAVLDTGSGKTLIAVLLLRHILDQELEDRAAGKPPRVSFFLVEKTTLVFQQFAVLESNLDHKIDRFCGGMGPNLWDQAVWQKYLDENMVLVCTAEPLYQALGHGLIKMSQINILIFDEAHHVKKGHSYARIIKDFYVDLLAKERPRIFGMTASPVDAGDSGDVRTKAMELETLLDATIATCSEKTSIQDVVNRAEELFVRYDPLEPAMPTQLHHEISARFDQIWKFKKLSSSALHINQELGSWCADMYWKYAFSERANRKAEARMFLQQEQKGDEETLQWLEKDIEALKQASEEVQKLNFHLTYPTTEQLSSKTRHLHSVLHDHFDQPTQAKCIVFVETRFEARLLSDLFNMIKIDHMRPGFLLGSSSGTEVGESLTYKKQVITLTKFRKGEYNCLFSTSVGEEGLDIQDCNIVIRFDLCKNMIQYVQSRGRARHRNSRFYHFIEYQNYVQESKLREVQTAIHEMRRFCQQLPADRNVANDDYQYILEDDPDVSQQYMTKAGAKLTFMNSMLCLQHFVDCLPRDEDHGNIMFYAVSPLLDGFISEVVLPMNSPVQRAYGTRRRRKLWAKQSAAFEACMQLIRDRHFDDNLIPIYHKRIPLLRNAQLAITTKKQSEYDMKVKPKFWEQDLGGIPDTLYLMKIAVQSEWERPVEPLYLVTRRPLPDLPSLTIYRHDGTPCQVTLTSNSTPFSPYESIIDTLTKFTLRVFRYMFNKTFEEDVSIMPYWLAICQETKQSGSDRTTSNLSDHVDEVAMQRVLSEENLSWKSNTPVELLVNRFVMDPYEGGKRYFTHELRADLHANDPEPPNTATGANKDRIVQYSNSLSKTQRKNTTWNPDQPVFRATKMSFRLNVLAYPTDVEKSVLTECFICLEPLLITSLSATFAATMFLFPAIIHRIESYLISLEFCSEVKLSVNPALALEAITKDCDNSDEDNVERINFQRGMGANYERLEFIGDTFLKMATTISLYARHAGTNEEDMHNNRMVMICNKNLLRHARARNLQQYIRGLSFERRTWYPHTLKLLKGKAVKSERTQPLGDKTIADICEATIGAALMSHYRSGYEDASQFHQAISAVSTFVLDENHAVSEWQDYLASYTSPKYQLQQANASERRLAEQLKEAHEYTFKYPRLAAAAFTHPSAQTLGTGLPSYQRLEFLGDALLDMTCVMHLVSKHDHHGPQWLTEHKTAMVSNAFLGTLSVKLGFNKHLRHNSTALPGAIKRFVEDVADAREQSGDRPDYWTSITTTPKCLSDVVEAYVGAMFVDSGFNFAEVQRFYDTHIKWHFDDMSIYDSFARDQVMTKLHHWLAHEMGCSRFKMMADMQPGPDGKSEICIAALMLHNNFLAAGRAASQKYAKIKTSKLALEQFEGMSRADFRRKFGCDCKSTRIEGVQQGVEEPDHGTAV